MFYKMKYLILAIIIILIVIYFLNKPTKENFELNELYGLDLNCLNQYTGYRPGNGKAHPNQDTVYAAVNDRRRRLDDTFPRPLDPDTIVKLEDTILPTTTKTSKTQVAFNDIGSYRPDRIRPFNDVQSRISNAQIDNGNDINDMFDNNYFALWIEDENRERRRVLRTAEELEKSKLTCVDFNNVNQCMSVCTGTPNCMGFYIAEPGKCCMMINPPLNSHRDRYNILPDNNVPFAFRTNNARIRYAQELGDKIVFDKLYTLGEDSTYKVPMSREQCKALCPKCIMGRCPLNYRCVNMTADPRYNYSCIIQNESRYNETNGNIFDGPNIPYLDDKYGLNEYAGYDMRNREPLFIRPDTYAFNISDGIVPTREELQQAFRDFDLNHTGPNTFGNCTFNNFGQGCTKQKAEQNYQEQCGQDMKMKNCKQQDGGFRTRVTGAGGTDLSQPVVQIGPEGFDPWINRSCYDPEEASDNPNFVAIRGGNDMISLDAWVDYTPFRFPNRREDNITANMIEKTI